MTGVRPKVRAEAAGLSGHAVLVGTLGKSAVIDTLAREGKFDAKSLRGSWESFLIATVKDPLPGVRVGLVVAALIAVVAVVAWFVLPILAAARASTNEGYRYPFTLRLIR